jgi:hypothetical protein
VRRHLSLAVLAIVVLATAALGAPSITALAAPTGPPVYANYPAPGSTGADAGEPSIGVNWKSGAVFLQAGFETLKATFDANNKATWTDASTLPLISLDPLLASDNEQGRVFVSQLTGFNSHTSYTDDDGQSYSPSTGGGIPSGADHQSIGAGPYPAGSPVPKLTDYPNAVYYCSQSVAAAFCARSDDGGRTFGAGVPLYTIGTCGGLHGHVRVGPDGTVYVPNKACGGTQAVFVSKDAGLTWTMRPVPGSTPHSMILDPSMGIASDNTGYFGFVGESDGQPKIAVTRDHGETWTKPIDVGAPLGIENATFPEVIAGDGDRAAFAWLGTKTDGRPDVERFGKDGSEYDGGDYYLYISTTLDRGATWKTVNATPGDPVQRGRICHGGGGCTMGHRNLLDFNDIQVDKQGRVLVGWADGCTLDCVDSVAVSDNKLTAKGTITRQVGGTLLFRSGVIPTVSGPKASRPPSQRPDGRGSGGLPATGGSMSLALVALVLLCGAALVRRQRANR